MSVAETLKAVLGWTVCVVLGTVAGVIDAVQILRRKGPYSFFPPAKASSLKHVPLFVEMEMRPTAPEQELVSVSHFAHSGEKNDEHFEILDADIAEYCEASDAQGTPEETEKEHLGVADVTSEEDMGAVDRTSAEYVGPPDVGSVEGCVTLDETNVEAVGDTDEKQAGDRGASDEKGADGSGVPTERSFEHFGLADTTHYEHFRLPEIKSDIHEGGPHPIRIDEISTASED